MPVSAECCGASWAPGVLARERGTSRCEPAYSLCDEFRSLLGRAHHWNSSWARWSTGIRNDYGPVRRPGNTACWTVWGLCKRWPLRDGHEAVGVVEALGADVRTIKVWRCRCDAVRVRNQYQGRRDYRVMRRTHSSL